MSKAIAAELPFQTFDESDIAIRKDVRANKTIIHFGDVYKIDLLAIKVRDGFNPRRGYKEIESLVDSIEANGLTTELVVDVLKTGEIFVERGHRRLFALNLIRAKYEAAGSLESFNELFGYIPCKVNSSKMSELQRTKNLYASNHFLPFTPIENSVTVARLKDVYNMTHEQIAKDLGMSRQSVDNYAKIAEMPDFVKAAIDDSGLSVNKALAVMRDFKDSQERNDAFQESLTNKNTKADNRKTSSQIPSSMKPIKDDVINPDGPELLDENEQWVDAGTDDLKDGLSTATEEMKLLTDTTGLLDKASLMCGHLSGPEGKTGEDISGLINIALRNLEVLRISLTKIQK